jgi:hypothetical protein
MLRAREIRPYGSPARYASLDLGRDQGSGRGEVLASFSRPTEDGKFECFTFVPDTLHNRVQLLLKSAVEVAEVPPIGPAMQWRRLTWKDLEPLLAPVMVEQEAPTEPAAEPSEVEESTEAVIGGLEDFLQLSRRDQLAAVKMDEFPDEKLQEIIDCTDGRLSVQARDAALAKAERLTGDSK